MRWYYWPLFALVMGIMLGWSFAATVQPIEQGQQESAAQTTQTQSPEQQETEKPFWVRATTDPVAAFTFGLLLFTGILAASTIGLMIQTRNLAKLAADQATSYLSAERPYVFLHVTSSGVNVGSQGEISFSGQLLRCSFENHGRTVAFLTELKEHFAVVEGVIDAPLPMDPMVTRGRLLPVGTTATPTISYNIAQNLMNTQAYAMYDKDSWLRRRLFFQGFVRYSDTFGKHYITGFLACFSPLGNVWVLRGGDEYNYTREEDPTSIPEWTPEAQEPPQRPPPNQT